MNILYILVGVTMLATLAVLATGLVVMAVGGKQNQRWSNRLMVARVTLQALVVALIAVIMLAGA